MGKIIVQLLLVITGFSVGQAVAQEPFYKGKIIKVVVGFSAGGGYDTYARLIGRHMTRHISGNPTIVVDNMPGAGSLVSANFLYRATQPDIGILSLGADQRSDAAQHDHGRSL